MTGMRMLVGIPVGLIFFFLLFAPCHLTVRSADQIAQGGQKMFASRTARAISRQTATSYIRAPPAAIFLSKRFQSTAAASTPSDPLQESQLTQVL
jgi:hypothetical protein